MSGKPQYPCTTCTKVKEPEKCENKLCKDWKDWFLKGWEALRGGSKLSAEKNDK